MIREKMRSVIVTTNAEFRMKSVSMLNNIAFAAEKVQARTVDEASAHLKADPEILNLVVDGTSFAIADAFLADKEIAAIIKERRGFYCLIYALAGATGVFAKSELVKQPNVLLAEMPIDRRHFMDVFHTRRSNANAAASGRQKSKEDPELKGLARDAAQHLKDVVDQVNGIATDRTRLTQLQDVGQRYNGIMGTFAFFAHVPGAGELAKIGTIIDSIARTYAKAEGRLADPHFELLAAGCRCTLPLLRVVALGEPIPEETTRLLAWMQTAFSADESLSKRQAIAQTAVDKAMAKRDESEGDMKKAVVEASSHLKSAIEHLNVVFNDHVRLDALTAAGQRFNGVFGTFAFYRQALGSSSLIELSTIVDDLCRSYVGANAPSEVAAEHIALLRDTAETCFFVLKELREGKSPQEVHKQKAGALVDRWRSDATIKKRQTIGQSEIDQLMADLGMAA